MDPRLTSAREISPDLSATLIAQLETVQEMFLRRAKKLGPSTLTDFLFTEMGVWPLRCRRLFLALCYLGHILALPHDWSLYAAVSEVARLALRDKPIGQFADVPKCYITLIPDDPPIVAFHALTPAMTEVVMK
ncbi:hypothetical protein FRB96_003744 [Tulasnella sp. 330]|nr:hypothetical protein FRB96_003744 [Tulasnella sp. 330]